MSRRNRHVKQYFGTITSPPARPYVDPRNLNPPPQKTWRDYVDKDRRAKYHEREKPKAKAEPERPRTPDPIVLS
jgi:hypothetical protein